METNTDQKTVTIQWYFDDHITQGKGGCTEGQGLALQESEV